MTMLIHIASFVFLQAIAVGGADMLGLNPRQILVVVFGAGYLWLVVAVCREPVLTMYKGDHPQSILVLRIAVPVFAAVVLGLLFLSVAFHAERRLYATGRYGEPPYNRIVCPYLDQQIVEFRVDQIDINAPFWIRVEFNRAITPTRFDFWFGPSSNPSSAERVFYQNFLRDEDPPKNFIAMQIDKFAVTPQASFYVRYAGEANDLELKHAYLGMMNELGRRKKTMVRCDQEAIDRSLAGSGATH